MLRDALTTPSIRLPLSPSQFCSLACLFAGVLLLTGCGGAPGHANEDGLTGRLQLTGSSTVAPLVSEIGKRYEALHPGVRIDIQTGGSSRGIADAANGLADIGMSSRELRDTEREGRRTWTLAQDGVAFLVHADNPVQGLSRQQLVDIFTGKIQNWSEVGGPEGDILLVNRAAGRSELDLLTDFLAIEAADIQPDLIAGENQQGLKMVASNPQAMTYLSVGASAYEQAHGAPIRLLSLDGVEATVDNVAAGHFPLARPLILITPEQNTGLAQDFIEYALSDAVHDLVQQFSYVPITS